MACGSEELCRLCICVCKSANVSDGKTNVLLNRLLQLAQDVVKGGSVGGIGLPTVLDKISSDVGAAQCFAFVLYFATDQIDYRGEWVLSEWI